MPTFTATALDRLIDSGASKSMTTASNVPTYKQERRDINPSTQTERVSNSKHERRNTFSTMTTTPPIDQKHPWVRIKPALYATPEPTPLPDSPSSFPPSPYIINHKRRGPRLLKRSLEQDVASNKEMVEERKVDENGKSKEADDIDLVEAEISSSSFPVFIEAERVNDIVGTENGLVAENCEPELTELKVDGDELYDFFDPRDSVSTKSNTEGEGGNGLDLFLYHSTPMAEFYDAWEELSTESGPQPPLRDVEVELREMRLSLLMEIEKRKQAEEVLDIMRIQWLTICEQLALVGIKLPADPVVASEAEQLDLDPAEELNRQLYLARFVSNSIGRGTAKAEVEMEMEAKIDLKNFEIARLCDRLQYYEAVNREMSQRNQETIETTRRLRQKRKRRQRWIWGAIAATITLGSGALAWSYVSTGKELSSTPNSFGFENDPLHQ